MMRKLFACYVILIQLKKTVYFRGVTTGIISDEPIGENAFGYDPIFLLPELGRTYDELTLTEKKKYSHRAKAFHTFKK